MCPVHRPTWPILSRKGDAVIDTMIQGLLSKLATEVEAAKVHKSGEKDENEVKIPVRIQSLGFASKNFAVTYTDEELTDFGGLTKPERDRLRELAAKVRSGYVAKYGETSTGFNSKDGTTLVTTLKSFLSMAEQGVYDLDPADAAAINEGVKAWYDNAPLRGRAAGLKSKAEEADNAEVENAA